MSTDLSKVKRPDLQRLAKQHGIKANQKSEKLISALQKILSVKNEASSPMPSAGVQSLSNTCAGEDNSTVENTSLESETEVSGKSLASEKENSVPTPSSVSLGLIDAIVSEDDAITTLSFLSSGTEVSASSNNKKQRKSRKKATANKKKSNTSVTPDTDDFKENSMHVTEKSIAKTEESTTQNRDVGMTIESIEPLWDDLEDDEFLDSSVECAAPALTRKTNVPEDQPAQTARKRLPRACKTPEIGDGGNAKTPADATNIPTESTTPVNNSKKQPTDKTFSVPRSRTKARTLPQVDTSKSATKPKATPKSATKPKATPKSATKRKATISATPIQNKVPRSTEKNWKKNLKQAVERVEQPTSSVGSKTPLFAATGVTVPGVKSKSTPGIFRKAHEKRFEKLESIDDYQKRKQERADRLLGTGKKKQVLSRLAQPKAAKATPAKNGRPVPNILTPINKNTLAQARKSSIKPPTVFKPTVTKTNKINTNFSARASKLVTPKKIAVTFAKSPTKAGKGATRTPTATRTPSNTGKRASRVSLTPFKTIGTPQSAKKKAFDLQESLKKSLPYVPHKGPLTKYQDPAKKSMQERLKNVKNPKGSTREKRRKENVNARRNAKSNMMMKRRGMKMT